MKNLIICLLFSAVLFSMCEKQTDTEFSKLKGNKFIFTVDRVASRPDVQYPLDSLVETNYIPADKVVEYQISFSDDAKTAIIDSSFMGIKVIDGEKSKFYQITQGLYAGGRFIIWVDNKEFQAEFTVYGSGIPILKSERGKLQMCKE
jgi:hypothetical protein